VNEEPDNQEKAIVQDQGMDCLKKLIMKNMTDIFRMHYLSQGKDSHRKAIAKNLLTVDEELR
jgi:hypothetical protein